MDIFEAILNRKTTNGYFLDKAVSLEHQHQLIKMASRAPSHFNSQPWRFILIDDDKQREEIAKIAGYTMEKVMEGPFFTRYRKYFRFNKDEVAKRYDGIFIDKLPVPLRPFIKQVFSEKVKKYLVNLGVSKMLGRDNKKLVEKSPLILAAMLDKEEYREGQLSGFYSILSLGMAIENIWLSCEKMGMGIQFISTPMEYPSAWKELKSLLKIPENLELMVLYRLGYLPKKNKRPKIDWTSSYRKPLSQYVFRNDCSHKEKD